MTNTTIKIQKKIIWDNKCGCIVDLDLLGKAVLWYSNSPVAERKSIYMYGKYAAVSIGKRKIHVHRLLMSYLIGFIIPTELSVHHLDENKMNDGIENLAIMVSCYHNKHHMQNFHPTEKQISATISANHKRKGTHISKRVNIPLEELRSFIKEGKSINWIATHFNCDWSTINERVHENLELLEKEK